MVIYENNRRSVYWNFYINSDIDIVDLKIISCFVKIDLVFIKLYL